MLFSANALKLIAIIAMLIDHTAHLFLPPASTAYIVMRFIGRITAPVMFYFVAEGYRRTKNINRYTMRLAAFAAISYVPFVYFMTHDWPNEFNYLELNVIYTIFIGFLFIRAKNEIKNTALKIAVMTILLILSIPGDWTYIALLMMLVFDHFHGDFGKQKFAYLIVILTAGNLISFFLVQPFWLVAYGGSLDFSVFRRVLTELGMMIPIFLLGRYNGELGKGGKLSKWGFYLFYPAHLILLALIWNWTYL